MENKNKGGKGGNAFIWGLLIGAVLTTFLTTQKGRRILRDVADFGFELLEDFIDRETDKNKTKPQEIILDEKEEAQEVATADIESEITETESSIKPAETKTNGNGHKKRLFRGVRKR